MMTSCGCTVCCCHHLLVVHTEPLALRWTAVVFSHPARRACAKAYNSCPAAAGAAGAAAVAAVATG
jgi:hypothetical protein